jgi:hypothetical protein
LPALISTLLENYQELQNTSRRMFTTNWTEKYEELFTGIREIKEDIKSSKITQMRIVSCLRGDIPRARQIALPTPRQSGLDFRENGDSIDTSTDPIGAQLNQKMIRESLIEV